MNSRSSFPAAPVAVDVVETRFGLRATSLLTELSDQLSHDVQERLRFARHRALEQRRLARAVAPVAAGGVVGFGSTLTLFGGEGPGWLRWLSVVPLLALVAGLFLIQYQLGKTQIEGAADIDAALLTDNLPPTAYSDAGFVEYLKTPRQ